MASESTDVLSDHSITPEQVEKVNEEVKKVEHDGSPPSKGSGEEAKLKAEELPSQPAPSAESEEKIEVKQIEPSLAEEVKKTDDTPVSDVSVDDKPGTPVVPESVVDCKSQPEDQPTIESVEKQPEEQPTIDAVEKQPEETTEIGSVAEPSVVADSAKSQPEKQPATESIEKQPEKQPPIKVVEKQREEQPKIVDILEPLVEAVEKTEEQVEVLLVKESEVVMKDTEISEAMVKKEEIPEPIPPKVEDKPQEQSEVTDQVKKECAEVEPKGSVEVEIAKDEETLADKIEDPKLLEEEQIIKEEPVVTKSSDQIISTNVDAQVDTKGDGGENPPTVVPDDKEKELSGTAAAEGLSKEEVVESAEVEVESEGKNVKTEEENEEKKAMTEESEGPKPKKIEEVRSSISPTEVNEKRLEGYSTSRDIELSAENGKESIKDEAVTSVKTEKTGEEGSIDEITTTTTAKEPVEEPQKSETEVKGEETIQTGKTNLEKEKEAGEIAKPDDVPTPESTMDVDDTKTSEEPPKEEVSAKPTSKQSNNIIAKVKQSLVKAKKAIIGKSHNSKTVSSETKGDIKDK